MKDRGRQVWCDACRTTHMVKQCQSCRAEIFFALSHNGRRGPYDVALRSSNGATVLWCEQEGVTRKVHQGQGHESHFATCPDADQWRRARAPVARPDPEATP